MDLAETLHTLVQSTASVASSLIELIALLLIIFTVLKAMVKYVKVYGFNTKYMHKDDSLIEGLTVALEVLLAGEILKTITASTKDTLVEIFLIILMRLFMTIVLHWEGSHKDDSHKSDDKHAKKDPAEKLQEIKEATKSIL